MRPAVSPLPNGIATDYSYNESNWLTQIKAAGATPPATYSAAYGFDKVGNITGKTTETGAHVYGYDAIYQLTSATIPTLPQEAYSYDKVGNRKTSAQTEGPWSYNKNNELLSYNGAVLTYDANGNTVTKSENGATTTYNYGATDRLASVQLPDGRTATYKYDPFGRRVMKQVGTQTSYFLYADEGLIGEYGANGSFSKGYGWRPNGVWGTAPVFMLDTGEYYFYHNDHLGTPQKMTDVNGAVVWLATYDTFGFANIIQESTIINNLRFPGQYHDQETELHYNWNRYYSPSLGKYLTTDPIGFNSDEIDLYRYAKNNPLSEFDYDGLKVYRQYSAGFGVSALLGVLLGTGPGASAAIMGGITFGDKNICDTQVFVQGQVAGMGGMGIYVGGGGQVGVSLSEELMKAGWSAAASLHAEANIGMAVSGGGAIDIPLADIKTIKSGKQILQTKNSNIGMSPIKRSLPKLNPKARLQGGGGIMMGVGVAGQVTYATRPLKYFWPFSKLCKCK